MGALETAKMSGRGLELPRKIADLLRNGTALQASRKGVGFPGQVQTVDGSGKTMKLFYPNFLLRKVFFF